MTDRARRARENRQGARAEGTVRSAARGSRRGHLSQHKSAAQAKRARETSRKRAFIAHHSPPARPLHTRSTILGTSTASKTFFRARRAMLGRARARTPPRQHETRPARQSGGWRSWWLLWWQSHRFRCAAKTGRGIADEDRASAMFVDAGDRCRPAIAPPLAVGGRYARRAAPLRR